MVTGMLKEGKRRESNEGLPGRDIWTDTQMKQEKDYRNLGKNIQAEGTVKERPGSGTQI